MTHRTDEPASPHAGGRRRRAQRALLAAAAMVVLVGGLACSPVYVVRAGIAEVGILRARRPIHEVLNDPTVNPDTRGKLAYVMEARRFAADELGIDVGDAYTMYTELERDTLAMVVSAAYKDRLQPKTWWFPIVGHVPYKGHFSLEAALNEEEDLKKDGLDTLVRPTSAFSTLGWFNDPVLSTTLRSDEVEVVTTVLHELAHQHLFVSGHVGFNESFATFAGRVGAMRFFCTREGSGPDSVKCARAQERWRDVQRFSEYLASWVPDLEALYADPGLGFIQKVSRREDIFDVARARFDADLTPTLETLSFASFRETPLNNATLLSRVRYYDRLPAFEAFLESHGGDLVAALDDLKARAGDVDDPFDLLPEVADREDAASPDPSLPGS